MKQYNFIYTESQRKSTPKNGGWDYTLRVYEISGGSLVYLGTISGNSASHKGFNSEAWDVIKQARLNLIKTMIGRLKKANLDYMWNPLEDAYFNGTQANHVGFFLDKA